MPDFFINNSRVQFNQNEDAVKNMNQNSKSYWDEQNARMQQKNAEYVEDLQRYSVNIPQEQYNIIKDAIANAEVPEDEAYRWAAAMELNNQYNIPIQSAYQNLEAINAALWGEDYQFTPKTNFKAIVDNGRIGANTLKMGEIGNKIMLAESKLNDGAMFYGEKELQELYEEYARLEQENASLSDNQARPFVIEALKFGAQSVPFTGAVIGASALGTILAPGVGTVAGFATSMANASGLQYIKLREAGSSQDAALGFSLVSGGLQALVEVSLGNVAGALGKTTLGDMAGEAVSNTITGNLFKRLTYDGTFKTLALRLGKEYVKENFEEGLEEVIQDLIEKGTDALAAELGGYEIDSLTAKQVARDAWENFRGGLMGSLVLGLPTSAIKVNADIKDFATVRSLSEEVDSQELFNVLTEDNPIFRDMTTQEKREAQKTTWENGQARKEARATEDARQIAEGRDAAEGAEEMAATEEGEEAQAQSVARDESGRLYTSDDGGTFLAGDATKNGKEEGNRYGYIKYTTDENGDITIDTFKMTEGREGLRNEVYDEFAREHPNVNINWNAIGSETQAMRQSLIDANPSGSKNGLNYYSSKDIDQIAARKKVAAEVRKNIHNVTKNADGTYTRTDLSNKQVAAAVTLIESAAKRMDMSLSDYVSKTFGNQIFGTREQFAQSALAQGDTISDKAGGMNQGVAQANWKQVGQQVKAVIYAGENADFSTWAHEMAHVFQNQLDGDLKTDAENAFNVQDGDWINSQYTFSDGRTMSSAEAFAYGFQDWLETGKAENQQMQNIFQKFAQFIADAYNKLKKHLNFTPEIESVFNKLLDGDDTIMSKALKAAQEEENEYRAGLKRKAEEAEAAKKAEAEEAEKQAELEKEEAEEHTEFVQAEQSAEEIENQLEESNEKETGNAIDNALENTNFTTEQKANVSQVLNDETTTIAEKADAIVDAAGEQFDLFQKQEGLLYQLAGEPSIRRMAESEEKNRILADLDAAKLMDERYKSMDAKSKAARIRLMTGWEKDATGSWKFELDDSVNRIKGGAVLNGLMRTSPELLSQASEKAMLNLGDIYDAPELYKVFPYMKNVRVSFYSDPNAFRAVLTPEGIKVNMRYLQGIEGEKGLKGALVHEIQHVVQAMEYADSKGLQGADIEQLYNDMMDAMQAAGERKYDYDVTSLQQGLEAYMNDYGEIEARNVARRVMYNADKRRNTTLESDEDVKRNPQLLYQITDLTQDFADISSGKITEQDVEKHIMSLIGQTFDTATEPLKIQLTKGNKAHILNSNVQLTHNRKKKHNAALNKVESIINNASMIGKSEPVDLTHNTNKRTLKHKQQVLKYVTFESPIKIGNDYYTVELITERVKGQSPELLDLYNVRVRKNNPANTLSNPNGLNASSQGQVNNNITTGNVNTGVMLFQDERDKEYVQAVESGDTEKAMQMLAEEAERKGYTSNSDYQGTSAFNGAAPYRNGYFETKEARLQAIKDEEFEDTETLGDFAYDNADALGFDYMINDPRAYRAADEKRKEAIDNLRSAIKEAKDGKKNVTIKMYRSVPADIKEGSFRNGDWITPAKSYAEDNAAVHRWGPGEYRIIEQDVDLENIWWDGNDIAEWGYDDEKEAVYKNTENNRKLFEITYDENGDLIPLSKRFDQNNPSILYQIAGEIGAQNLDDAETQEGVSRMQNLAIAKQMEADGKDAQAIRLATGWEKGDDGYWKFEIPDGEIVLPTAGQEVNSNGKFVPRKQKEGYLKEYYKSEELYKAYPDLNYVFVRFVPLDVDGRAYYAGGDKIDLNIKYLSDNNTEEVKKILAHEIQHVIQRIEGFAKGGNTEQFKPLMSDDEIRMYKDVLKGTAHINRTKADEIKDRINKDINADKLLQDFMPKLRSGEETLDSWFDYLETEQMKHPDYMEYRKYKLAENDAEEEYSHLGKYQTDNGEWITPGEAYLRLAGETESRNVESRINFTPEQRLNTLIAATEDVATEDKIILFQTVYHGSPHNFENFSTENIGTGEGAQSFGWGLYFTNQEGIARFYADSLANNDKRISLMAKKDFLKTRKKSLRDVENKEKYEARINRNIKHFTKELKQAQKENDESQIKFYEGLIDDSIKQLDESERQSLIESFKKDIENINNEIAELEKSMKNNRNLYSVEIPDEGYLLWDKEYSAKELEGIKKALYDRILDEYFGGDKESAQYEVDAIFDTGSTGEELYHSIQHELGGDKAASLFLKDLGYVGIDYPANTIAGKAVEGERNYVIFDDFDIKIVDHLLYQTNAELMQEAQGFESWQEFMEFCEVMHSDDEVSPIPSEADAQWYQSFWETAHGLQTEQEKNEQTVKEKVEKETITAKAMDALFVTYIRSNPEMLDDFLHEVARIDAIDLDSDEWRNVEDDMDAAQRDKIDQLKDAIAITMSDYNWQSAMRRVQGGGEISEGMRKRLMGEMTDTMKSRDFRALYAEVMEDAQYAVDEEDTTASMLSKKLQKYQKRYYDIVKPGEDISKMSPEKRKRIAEAMANRDIANKIKNGSLKLDDELDAYIKSLDAQIKEKQKQFDELEKETKADYQRIADAEKRRLLKLHDELLIARSKLTQKNSDIARKVNKGLKITEKYKRESQNLQANYDELFRKFNDLKNTIQITAEVQAALDRQEQVATVREDLNAKQKEKNLTAEVKKMRINLVKRTMRRVPFNRIDYDNAKTVIAIQRMLEPNLIGGVNRFIGIDSVFLRGVISQIVTDSDYKEKILDYLAKNSRSSEAFVNFKNKLTNLKSIKDFDSWTAKERKAAIKYLPKENWVRDLNLKELAKEREESIDLDIDTEEYSRPVYDENGRPKTYKDADGIEHNVTETAYRLRYSDELGRIVKDAVGADMFDRIVNMPFSEWTTEDLEQLAQRIDELYTEGRDLLAAKNEAKRREADTIRKRVEDAIKETGIVINDDDTPEEKERKQKEIDKILNLNSGLKGTEAGKTKGIKARLDRLIHGYADMNVLRFARMLDNQSEGENVRLLYRMEDDCYNAKTRSINNRARAINEIMKANNITEGDLAMSIPVPSLNTEFTVDELLYFLAADKDYAEDETKLAKGLFGIDANDDYAATSRNAVMFGNMMSDTLSQEEKERWAELDKQMKDAIENDTLTTEQKQLLTLGQLDKTPGTSAYISYCHAKWLEVLAAANSFLAEHPEYTALMEAIEADYAAQYERMNEVSINEFNMPVHRVKAYVPLVRRESNGETNVNQVREDLIGAYGGENTKQWVNKGMTQRRVNISPLNQKPVETGLFKTWGSSLERTEHFIAYSPYVRQLNAVYKSRDASYTRRFIESRYGKSAIEYLDSYINEVANPNAGRIREKGSEWLHALRGKTAPAYLGWKFSAIVKQGLTSPWPYMQFVNPAEYAAAALECTRKGTYDAIREKSVFMNNRVMDPMNELVDEMAENAKTKMDRAWSKFGKKGMAGLEWIDWVCVAPGWLACYKKEYNRLEKALDSRYNAKMDELRERNMYADVGTSEYMTPDQMEAQARKEMLEDIETEAVRYADDCTRQCQPSSRATDLAPLFKNSSEAMKAFLQFQTSLNVIWQNIRYDMPYAVRNKQFNRIVGTVLGYVFAGIFMNSVMDGVTSGAKDDDDKEKQALRNLIFYSTTQFTDAIPIMGSEITNTMDQLITGKRGFMNSGTDMTPSATKLLSVLTNARKGNWEKAGELTAEGIGLFLGAPVSGTKEVYKLLGKPMDEGNIDFARGISDVYGIAGDILEQE